MIIVEGTDGGGKTTLIRQLMEDYPDWELGKRGTTDRTKLWTVTRSDTYRALSMAVDARQDYPIQLWDRLFYSELIYPQHTGRKCQFSVPEVAFTRRVIGAIGCPVIVCLPPLENVRENVQQAKQMSGVVEAIDKIWEDYHSLFKAAPTTNVIWYDYTGTRKQAGFVDYVGIKQRINHYLAQRETRTTT